MNWNEVLDVLTLPMQLRSSLRALDGSTQHKAIRMMKMMMTARVTAHHLISEKALDEDRKESKRLTLENPKGGNPLTRIPPPKGQCVFLFCWSLYYYYYQSFISITFIIRGVQVWLKVILKWRNCIYCISILNALIHLGLFVLWPNESCFLPLM